MTVMDLSKCQMIEVIDSAFSYAKKHDLMISCTEWNHQHLKITFYGGQVSEIPYADLLWAKP